MNKRIVALSLAATLLLGCSAGCTKKSTSKEESTGHKYTDEYDETKYNKPGTFPIFKEKKVITANVSSSTYVEDFNTNYMTTLMEDELNADLQLTVLPSKEYSTKINLMAAAGGDDFCDAIIGKFSDAVIMNYASSDVIIPVTDYYYNTSIAYYLNQAKERVGFDFFPQVTMPNGEIYGVAQYSDSISNVNPDKMFVYVPWLEQLGYERTESMTTETFKEYLTKIRDTDLNGNGLKDEIPTVQSSGTRTWFDFMMNPFVYCGDDDYLVVEDGELSFAYQHEQEWKQGLKYMKDLYDEGLISPLTFSQDSNSMKSLINNQTTVVGSFCSLGAGGISADDPRRMEYEAIPPLTGADGKAIASYSPTKASTRFLINAKTADAESVFRFGDLMCSEEISICQAYGEKGVDYLEAKPGDKGAYDSIGYPASIKSILPWSTLQNKHWYQTGPYIRSRSITAGLIEDETTGYSVASSQLVYEGHNPDEYITKLIFTTEENEVAETGLADLDDYVWEMSMSFITGEKDIDKDWDEFSSQVEAMNSEDILSACQSAFDRLNDQMEAVNN